LSLVIDEHRQYLSDKARLAAFSSAVLSTVRHGDIVIDLASGTGIMGLLACRAGARRVYSIEEGGICVVAQQVASANGFGDRVRFIKGHSRHVHLPEKVDVVIADQIGNFGFNAGLIQYFADARQRFLKPQGTTIPRRLDLIVAPVEDHDLFGQVEFWNTCRAGFDFKSTRVFAANTGYQVNLSPSSVCGKPAVIASLDLNHATTRTFRGETRLTVSRSCTLHGLGGWFDAELAKGITITNSPIGEPRIQRRQIYFPIDRAVSVREGDNVCVRLTVRPTDSVVNWNVDIVDARSGDAKARFRHSTWKGMLLSREDILRTQPDFRPKLIPRGEARRSVVNLCDGVRTVSEIEEELLRIHPNLFRSRDEAAVFVAEVVTRYAE
jgi:protein arginine N-methyltransferase 1